MGYIDLEGWALALALCHWPAGQRLPGGLRWTAGGKLAQADGAPVKYGRVYRVRLAEARELAGRIADDSAELAPVALAFEDGEGAVLARV